MLELGLQAAASWASLLCVYSFNGFKDCMLSISNGNDFSIWFCWSFLEGKAPSPLYICDKIKPFGQLTSHFSVESLEKLLE